MGTSGGRRFGGGGGGGGGGAKAEADAVAELIERMERELELLRETDPVKKEMLRYREQLATATDAERAKVEELIATRIREDQQIKARSDLLQYANDMTLQFLNTVIVQGKSARGIVTSLINELLRAFVTGKGVFAEVFNIKGGIWDILLPKRQDGGMVERAEGGMVDGPLRPTPSTPAQTPARRMAADARALRARPAAGLRAEVAARAVAPARRAAAALPPGIIRGPAPGAATASWRRSRRVLHRQGRRRRAAPRPAGGPHGRSSPHPGPSSETVIARVSNGEFMAPPAVVARHRALLEGVNAGMAPAFASGGMVGRATPRGSGVARGGETARPVFNIFVNGATGNAEVRRMVSEGVAAGLRVYDADALPRSVIAVVEDPKVTRR